MPGAISQPSMSIRPPRGCCRMLAALMLLFCAVAFARQPGLPKGVKHESRHEIDQLEEQWRQAVLKSNPAALQSILGDDYLGITSSGTLQTKQQTLDNLRAGRMRFTQLDISDRKVRFYGATALVTSVADVQGTTGEGNISGSYRYTHVYVRDPARAWKIVSFEVSRIREPGDHPDHK